MGHEVMRVNRSWDHYRGDNVNDNDNENDNTSFVHT